MGALAPTCTCADQKTKAPGLWGVIVFKLSKGMLFLAIAAGIFTLTDNNLPGDFRRLLLDMHFDPERQFWTDVAIMLGMGRPETFCGWRPGPDFTEPCP